MEHFQISLVGAVQSSCLHLFVDFDVAAFVPGEEELLGLLPFLALDHAIGDGDEVPTFGFL
jgi:hypothetical protein